MNNDHNSSLYKCIIFLLLLKGSNSCIVGETDVRTKTKTDCKVNP